MTDTSTDAVKALADDHQKVGDNPSKYVMGHPHHWKTAEVLLALMAERDGLLTTWAESRNRHLAAEAERDDLRAKLDAAVEELRKSRKIHVAIADHCLERKPMTLTAGIFADSQRARLAIDAILAKIKGADK